MPKVSTKVDGRPSFQFYPTDHLEDTALRGCSLEAQGLWARMLCHMFDSPQRGALRKSNGVPIDAAYLAGQVGKPLEEVEQCLEELLKEEVYSVLEDGAIYNRRMFRLWSISKARGHAGSQGGKAKWKQKYSKALAKETTYPEDVEGDTV